MPSITSNPASSRVAFGLYEVDLTSGELWKAGYRVKLQSQPFKVLVALLERPGQVVTREELQLRLWGKNTVVDFDHSLGTAINKIREALGDSAENPRFVETLSRRGYRFIAPVSRAEADEPAPGRLMPAVEITSAPSAVLARPAHAVSAGTAMPPVPAAVAAAIPAEAIPAAAKPFPPAAAAVPAEAALPERFLPTPYIHLAQNTGTRKRGAPFLWSALAVCLLALAAVGGYFLHATRFPAAPPHIRKLTRTGHLAPSSNNMENLAASATDGVHLFSPVLENGHSTIAAIALAGGMAVPLNIPAEIASPALGDISPDGSRLLVREHLSPESEQPLWVVPTLGGSAQRVGGALAHEATWMPDGESILYATGNDLYVTHLTGNNPQLYASLPGRAFWMRWEPNGKLLRFSIIDPVAHTLTLWQLSPGNRHAVPVLPGFTTPPSECCGVWTADGSAFIFQSSHGGSLDLWKLRGESTSDPVRITDGPLQFEAPVAARTGNRVYFLGVDARSELERVTAYGLIPEKSFIAPAVRIDYTRDGKWVAWTDDVGGLWRARTDGTEQLQLTPGALDVFLAHWSPDGSSLALMAREPGKAWNIYTIGANGNDLQPVLKGPRNFADPSWSPDGQSLVFGRVDDMMGKESDTRTLQVLNLRTGQIAAVPGSDNLFSPRWSPDGRYIAALSLDQRHVRVLDLTQHAWSTLGVPSGADPVWSSDSRFLYLHASLDPAQPIDRVSIADGKVQEVVRLADSVGNDAVDYIFVGLTPDNVPLIRSRVFTGNMYSTLINN